MQTTSAGAACTEVPWNFTWGGAGVGGQGQRRLWAGLGALVLMICSMQAVPAFALGEPTMVIFAPQPKSFPIVDRGTGTKIFVSSEDWPGVRRAVQDLCNDLHQVTGVRVEQEPKLAREDDVILVGTLGKSPEIDDLVRRGKLDVTAIRGQWEAGVTAVVTDPFPGIRRAVVIAGSDKRGAIFGVYTLSEQIGVSPWYWWADVRVAHHESVYVRNGAFVMPSPAVKYRGIFLNDEAPSLTGYVNEKFGGFNHEFYSHVFELLLRLHANYLWPAMWNSAFNEDDAEDPKLADEYGIVMGTSHHEPMLRAQQEWKRHGTGPWNYSSNANVLNEFWTRGIERNREYESTITIGMRGDGDLAMSPTADTALLEHIVEDQRKIIAAHADPAVKDPQIWALYKEVQEYYEKGMRVPEDVTLLWCDDNWGNLRRLPTAEERKRSGGAGIYYHVDYVGDPRSYKWLNTYNIGKIWEQMNLALAYGADRVWVLNVGDLKPMEFPLEFFLHMAAAPREVGKDTLQAYTIAWATREFGAEHAVEIADLVSTYTRYNSRRKPEQLEPDTYSFFHDHEADRVEEQWRELGERAERVKAALPANEQASFFELVLYPLKASATVGEMYVAAGRNRLYAREGRASANLYAQQVQKLFALDAELSDEYNHKLLSGKWDHMMDQTHIGYTFWNQPPLNAMPAVQLVQPLQGAHMSVFAEGSDEAGAGLPAFDDANRQTWTLEVVNRGTEPFAFRVKPSAPWIVPSMLEGTASGDQTISVHVDWSQAPLRDSEGSLTISRPDGDEPPVKVAVQMRRAPVPMQGFAENNGVVSIDAQDATAHRDAKGISWSVIPGFGETRSGMGAFPVALASTPAGTDQACLEYKFSLFDPGKRELTAFLAPTLPFVPGRGLRYSVRVDQQAPVAVDAWATKDDTAWRKAVSDGVHKVSTDLGKLRSGVHRLEFCRVDDGVVLERLLIHSGNLPETYLGPPESVLVGDLPPQGSKP